MKVITFEQWKELEKKKRGDDGLQDCEECSGAAKEACVACDGYGERECDLGHMHECEQCDGKGRFACRACAGKGVIDVLTYEGYAKELAETLTLFMEWKGAWTPEVVETCGGEILNPYTKLKILTNGKALLIRADGIQFEKVK